MVINSTTTRNRHSDPPCVYRCHSFNAEGMAIAPKHRNNDPVVSSQSWRKERQTCRNHWNAWLKSADLTRGAMSGMAALWYSITADEPSSAGQEKQREQAKCKCNCAPKGWRASIAIARDASPRDPQRMLVVYW
jgi:hypothetical protein